MLAPAGIPRYIRPVDETFLNGPYWTDELRAIWRRITSHAFESPHDALDFLHRLARDKAWPLDHARAAIEEYRRFCFLSVVSVRPVTPSQDVDEVWHLHLTYSRDYWETWCGQTLRRRLHHDPTEGGPAEARKFREQYAATLAEYETWFGPPPEAMWPSTQRRFAARPRFRTVDTERVMLLPRPRLPMRWALGTIAMLGVTVYPLQVLALPSNPLDWPAGSFLMLFAGEFMLAMVFALGWRHVLRSTGPAANDVDLDPVELGFLAGGPNRAFDTAIVELMSAGIVSLDVSRRLHVTERAGAAINAFQRHLRDGASYRDAKRAVRDAVSAIQERLALKGLALDTRQASRAAFLPLVVFLPVVPLGLLKLQVGMERGRPIGFLGVMMLAMAVGLWAWARRRPWRSRAGDAAMKQVRSDHARLMRAPQEAELSLAVALVGTSILVGTPFAGYAQLARQDGGDSGGSGCSGGGDGGGGSGCGGCSS